MITTVSPLRRCIATSSKVVQFTDGLPSVMFWPMFAALLHYSNIPASYSEENIQECGIRFAVNRHKPVISHGFEAERLEYPWHVALYHQYNPSQEPEYLCGGSIVNHNTVITAAHCVYNESTYSIDNAKFTVVAGKYYRSWNHTDPIEQRYEVSEIRIPETYLGLPNRYSDDIAILALNDSIKFDSAIMPICIDWSSEFHRNESLIPGTVVGWGYTQNGNLSNLLMEAKLNFFNFTSCRERVEDGGFSSFVTSDKFCAGVDNGTSVEQGDSGGGFVVPRNSTGNTVRYYLLGIVSTKDTWTNRTAAFTDVSIHLRWINSTMESIKNLGYCPPFESSKVELAQCSNNGTAVGCDAPSKLGTKAKVRCKSGFHEGKPYRLYTDTECLENRTWAPLMDSCMTCGIRKRGYTAKERNSPETWHVNLYTAMSSEKLEFYCGGTLLHPRAVVTAAHCVHALQLYTKSNNTKIRAVIGKHFCNLNHTEPGQQIFEVSNYFIKESYVGYEKNYMDDIAILELNDTVKLSEKVMPPCIDWTGTLELYKNPLITGLSMGCGGSDVGRNGTMKNHKLRFIENDECSSVAKEFGLAPDKICAATDDGSADLRFGYSGGSFTYPKYNEKTREQIHYLYGIVSHSVMNIIRFTDITYHIDWIKEILITKIINDEENVKKSIKI